MEKSYKSTQQPIYPPSVLVVADGNRKAVKLRRWLENKGCQAYETDFTSVELAGLCQKYFDLVVLDVEASDISSSKAYKQLQLIYEQLKAIPEFFDLPVVLLTDQAKEELDSTAMGPIYCIPKDSVAKFQLLQIIQQTHYLSYRYV